MAIPVAKAPPSSLLAPQLPKAPLKGFPVEILGSIFSYLPEQMLATSVPRVCKCFHMIQSTWSTFRASPEERILCNLRTNPNPLREVFTTEPVPKVPGWGHTIPYFLHKIVQDTLFLCLHPAAASQDTGSIDRENLRICPPHREEPKRDAPTIEICNLRTGDRRKCCIDSPVEAVEGLETPKGPVWILAHHIHGLCVLHFEEMQKETLRWAELSRWDFLPPIPLGLGPNFAWLPDNAYIPANSPWYSPVLCAKDSLLAMASPSQVVLYDQNTDKSVSLPFESTKHIHISRNQIALSNGRSCVIYPRTVLTSDRPDTIKPYRFQGHFDRSCMRASIDEATDTAMIAGDMQTIHEKTSVGFVWNLQPDSKGPVELEKHRSESGGAPHSMQLVEGRVYGVSSRYGIWNAATGAKIGDLEDGYYMGNISMIDKIAEKYLLTATTQTDVLTLWKPRANWDPGTSSDPSSTTCPHRKKIPIPRRERCRSTVQAARYANYLVVEIGNGIGEFSRQLQVFDLDPLPPKTIPTPV